MKNLKDGARLARKNTPSPIWSLGQTVWADVRGPFWEGGGAPWEEVWLTPRLLRLTCYLAKFVPSTPDDTSVITETRRKN